jgi:hypothetical protein
MTASRRSMTASRRSAPVDFGGGAVGGFGGADIFWLALSP